IYPQNPIRKMRNKMISKKVIWLFGLSGAGKTTLSRLLSDKLEGHGQRVVQLDGDELRAGLNSDLGFSGEDRTENIRRASHIARLLAAQNILCIGSFITPLDAHRQLISDVVGDELLLVYVTCPVSDWQRRDVKWRYQTARERLIPNFPAISASFEAPGNAILSIDTHHHTPEE